MKSKGYKGLRGSQYILEYLYITNSYSTSHHRATPRKKSFTNGSISDKVHKSTRDSKNLYAHATQSTIFHHLFPQPTGISISYLHYAECYQYSEYCTHDETNSETF